MECPDTLVETLLSELLGRASFSETFFVEQAHRSLGPRPPPGTLLQPLIARLLKFRDRNTISRLAREKVPLRYQGSVKSIYPDFIFAVQEARCKFVELKCTLWSKGIKYAMLGYEWN